MSGETRCGARDGNLKTLKTVSSRQWSQVQFCSAQNRVQLRLTLHVGGRQRAARRSAARTRRAEENNDGNGARARLRVQSTVERAIPIVLPARPPAGRPSSPSRPVQSPVQSRQVVAVNSVRRVATNTFEKWKFLITLRASLPQD